MLSSELPPPLSMCSALRITAALFSELHRLSAVTAAFPAHLHIDIVASAQRQGLGTKLMEAQLAHLTELGAVGVHLGAGSDGCTACALHLVPLLCGSGCSCSVRVPPSRFTALKLYPPCRAC